MISQRCAEMKCLRHRAVARRYTQRVVALSTFTQRQPRLVQMSESEETDGPIGKGGKREAASDPCCGEVQREPAAEEQVSRGCCCWRESRSGIRAHQSRARHERPRSRRCIVRTCSFTPRSEQQAEKQNKIGHHGDQSRSTNAI